MQKHKLPFSCKNAFVIVLSLTVVLYMTELSVRATDLEVGMRLSGVGQEGRAGGGDVDGGLSKHHSPLHELYIGGSKLSKIEHKHFMIVPLINVN